MSDETAFKPLLDQSVGYGVVVGVGFFFAGLMMLLTLLQSKFSRFSPSSSEEFSAASRSVKPGLVCCGIVSAWTWSATLLQSSTAAYTFGLSGPWWYGVGGTIQLAFFAIVAAKVKMNANGAHTFLEACDTSFEVNENTELVFRSSRQDLEPGPIFCLHSMASFVISWSAGHFCVRAVGGAATVNALTGMNIVAACFLLPIGIAVYVIFGGLRATFICDWVHTIILFVVIYLFLGRTYGTSPEIGSIGRLYELLVQAGVDTPVTGNQAGSYLTMKSNQGLVFGAATMLTGFSGVFCDQGYWQRAIASAPQSTTKAYTSAGLAAPAAAVVLMGRGGAVAILLVVFMAVTSAASAELIAVSSLFSYDIYRTYLNPKASGAQIVRISHYFICFWAVWMGAWATILHKASIDLGWLFYVQGVVLSPAVVPIGLTVTWAKLTRAGVFMGSIVGAVMGMLAWMIGCWKIYGEINITNLALPYSAVCSGLTGLLFSGVFTVLVSLAKPDKYDFQDTRAIAIYAASEESLSDKVEEGSDDVVNESSEKVDVDVQEVPSDGSVHQEPPDLDSLQKIYKKATVYSILLALAVTIVVPLPMFFAHYVFSRAFYTFWVACSIQRVTSIQLSRGFVHYQQFGHRDNRHHSIISFRDICTFRDSFVWTQDWYFVVIFVVGLSIGSKRAKQLLHFGFRCPILDAFNPRTAHEHCTSVIGPATETGIIFPTITPESFSPFPVPSDTPIANIFPETNPLNPPSSADSDKVIPDFGQAWRTAHSKAKARISSWTLEQKVNASTGVGWEGGVCVGNIPTIADWQGLCLEDSPLGVRDTDFVTAFPTGINTAATFNRTLMRIRGQFMGAEHKGKGVNVALGPMMNMGRIAQGGRNWEGFGADPFLTGETAYETILGMQSSGVQACAKHFINNEQEHKRTQASANVDDRTQHEIYAHPFLRSVQAGVASVMCSYNLINDTFACDNDKMVNDVLKREFGFQGYVMSDWSAQHTTESAMTGLDMTMPGDITFNSGTSYFGQNLTDYVLNGTIPQSRIDDMATRVLAGWYLLGQDTNYPAVSLNAFQSLDPANLHVDVQEDHFTVVREIGAASAVLLKNTNNALPLQKPKSVILVGNDAGPAKDGPNEFSDRGGVDGILAMGWGSGTAQFPYLISPLEAIQTRARQDGAIVTWFLDNFNLGGAASAVQEQDVALVFVNADSGEGYITVDGNEGDRKNLTLWLNADNLIQTVAANNKNTIVVVNSVGPAIIEPWIDHPNVTALVWAGLSGQEAGNSITDILYGAVNPSGRLPYTIAKSPADYPAQLITGGGANDILSIPYTEGLNIDYRHFDAANIEPRFEFGFGLSYTTFKYSALQIEQIQQFDRTSADLEAKWAAGEAAPLSVGSSAAIWLHRPAVQVTFQVQNTGKVAGGEIPQLYVQHPSSAGEPPSVLKGFTDVLLQPGQLKTTTLTLSRYDLSIWDTVAQGWVRPKGTIKFMIGKSSRIFELQGTVPL
ncbi:hypothetical protein EUX98_g6098 [Antrodiella citrinella]|uniref:beta-glucosidase n=1 Tax=Antrodiella citrinella TaxID=2447956 RepID=A0A4S4MQ04_9APHY|nr:hypothetical protein EUX98_g6098 [Antrodiella citrinella]